MTLLKKAVAGVLSLSLIAVSASMLPKSEVQTNANAASSDISSTYKWDAVKIGGGGFVSEQLGFLATTDQHQLEPRLYQTRDGGTTWEKMPMKLPTLTGLLRAEALTPQRVEDGAIVIPVRVYQQRSGGQWVHILQYISRDEGMTWEFAQQEG